MGPLSRSRPCCQSTWHSQVRRSRRWHGFGDRFGGCASIAIDSHGAPVRRATPVCPVLATAFHPKRSQVLTGGSPAAGRGGPPGSSVTAGLSCKSPVPASIQGGGSVRRKTHDGPRSACAGSAVFPGRAVGDCRTAHRVPTIRVGGNPTRPFEELPAKRAPPVVTDLDGVSPEGAISRRLGIAAKRQPDGGARTRGLSAEPPSDRARHQFCPQRAFGCPRQPVRSASGGSWGWRPTAPAATSLSLPAAATSTIRGVRRMAASARVGSPVSPAVAALAAPPSR